MLPVLVGLRRAMERDRRNRGTEGREVGARSRKRQLPRRDWRTDRSDSVTRKRDRPISAPARSSIPPRPKAMRKLPAIVKARATGGNLERERRRFRDRQRSRFPPRRIRSVCCAICCSGLESRLRFVRRDVERREALAIGDAVDLADARMAHRHLWRPQRSVQRRVRAFIRASTSPPTKASPCLATADGTVESRVLHRRLRQPRDRPARIRPGDALRTLSGFAVKPGRDRQARRRHRLCRLHGPRDRRTPALRNPG